MTGNKTKSARNLTYISIFTSLLAISAWISIPFAIPFTMQTFAVLLMVGLLGRARSMVSLTVYLILGGIGIPVFSCFTGGLGILLGPTGGYLFGFFVTILVTGSLFKVLPKNFPGCCVAMTVGILSCYIFGTFWYMVLYLRNGTPIGMIAVLMKCVIPFLLPDGCKILLAAWCTGRFSKLIKIDNN